MIAGFNGKVTRDIWESNNSKTLPREISLWTKALLTIMHSARTLEELRIAREPPNIRLHKLSGDRRGYWSIPIKLPWCITLRYGNGECSEVKMENYHRG